jgi:phage/plasmid-like protein (TIGR03299 family)
MAHMVETMAFAGETPWHGLGVKVPADLSPEQMLEKAGLNWTVRKVPAYADVAGKKVAVGQSALVRDSDDSILDVVSDDWNVFQNHQAFEFFHDFVANGDMEMHTAGSLRNGQLVWALAKVHDGFELFKGDQVDSYLLFSNPHKYGWSIDVRFTPIRVVCNNTLTLSLNTSSKNFVKVSHRREFDADTVKETLGVAKEKLAKYKEMAQFLGSKRYTEKTLVEYFKNVFPVTGTGSDKKKEMSVSASKALDVVHTQPGANFAEGSWWSAFNTVTYMVDHKLGRNQDNRLTNAWFGNGKKVKADALETAIEYAQAA